MSEYDPTTREHDREDPWSMHPLSITCTPTQVQLDRYFTATNSQMLGRLKDETPGGIYLQVGHTTSTDGLYGCRAQIGLHMPAGQQDVLRAAIHQTYLKAPFEFSDELTLLGIENKGREIYFGMEPSEHAASTGVLRVTHSLKSLQVTALPGMGEAYEEERSMSYGRHEVDSVIRNVGYMAVRLANLLLERHIHGLELPTPEESILSVGLIGHAVPVDLRKIGQELEFVSPIHQEAEESPSASRTETAPHDALQALVGMERPIRRISEAIELMNTDDDFLQRYRLRPSRAILLEGPPGVGKTELVEAIAEHYDLTLITITSGDILTKYIGEPVAKLRETYENANKVPGGAIVFFDEFDGLFSGKAGGNEGTARTLVSEFKQLLARAHKDYPDVLTIAATNSLDNIDPALLRAGRFDKPVRVFPPDTATRAMLFQSKVHETLWLYDAGELNFTEEETSLFVRAGSARINYESLAGMTEGFTGADITDILEELRTGRALYEKRTGLAPDAITEAEIITAIQDFRRNRPSQG